MWQNVQDEQNIDFQYESYQGRYGGEDPFIIIYKGGKCLKKRKHLTEKNQLQLNSNTYRK